MLNVQRKLSIRNLRAIFAALGACLSITSYAQSKVKIDLECVSIGDKPTLECSVLLRDKNGSPLRDSLAILSASMPSMPMAHSIRPAVTVPTDKPGEYRGSLQLEMAGVWAIQVDVSKPYRERLVQSIRIDICEAGKRCVAPRTVQTNKIHP